MWIFAQVYTSQITIENPKKGTSTLEYYSITPDGHQEATHTEALE